jgi:HlyD family secretion protein
MKKRAVIIVAVLAILGAGGAALFSLFRDNGSESVLEASGTVEVTEVNLGFKMPGRLAVLSAEEGQKVRAGEQLAVLDSAELKSIAEQNRAAVRHAEAELERAARDFERARQLFADGVFTDQQLDAAKRNHDVARSLVDQAQAALRASEVRLSDTRLSSPVSGVVLERNAESGETVGAGQAVYTVGDLEEPWIRVYVRETKLGLVKLGQKATVSVDTYPGKRYPGKVVQISSEAEFTPKNVQTQEERVKLVFGVKVRVENMDDELKPGMPADVKINLR